MNNKSRRVLYLVGGLYLLYLSFTLISGQMKEATSNMVIAIGAGILFFVFGTYLVIDYVRKSIKEFKENEEQENQIEAVEEKEEE